MYMKSKEKSVLEKLYSEIRTFSPGIRVILTDDISDEIILKKGEKGTVLFTDDLGTKFISWDSGIIRGIYLGENTIKKITEPSLKLIETDYSFYAFIDALRNELLGGKCIITGSTESLDFKQTAAVLSFSLDGLLADSVRYHHHIGLYEEENGFLNIQIGLYDRQKNEHISIMSVDRLLYVQSSVKDSIMNIIDQNYEDILNGLFEKFTERLEENKQ